MEARKSDPTENIRKERIAEINSQVETNEKEAERTRLEALYGQVWSTNEMSQDFEALGFIAPFIVVRRKSDGKKGSLEFQHNPRFYFNWTEA